MVLDVFAMLNLQYLGIMPKCRMSNGWSFKRIWKKDLGIKVLVVYAMVSFQHMGIIARQNTCRLIYGCIQYFMNVWMEFFQNQIWHISLGIGIWRGSMFPLAEHFFNQSNFYFFYDVNGLNPIQVNLFTPYLDEIHGQCDNNVPACFVFPLQKFWIMLKELFSLWVNQMILWWYWIKGIAALLLS